MSIDLYSYRKTKALTGSIELIKRAHVNQFDIKIINILFYIVNKYSCKEYL